MRKPNYTLRRSDGFGNVEALAEGYEYSSYLQLFSMFEALDRLVNSVDGAGAVWLGEFSLFMCFFFFFFFFFFLFT